MQWQLIKKIFLPALLVGATAVVAFFVIFICFDKKIAPRTTIAGVLVGGMSLDEAQSSLESIVAHYKSSSMNIKNGDVTVQIPFSQLGATVDYSAAISDAYTYANSDNNLLNTLRSAKSELFKRAFYLNSTCDTDILKDTLKYYFPNENIDTPQPTFSFMANGRLTITAPENKTQIDLDTLSKEIIEATKTLSQMSFNLPIKQIPYIFSDASIVSAQTQALNLIKGAPLILNVANKQFTLSKDDAAKFVIFSTINGNNDLQVSLSDAAIRAYLSDKVSPNVDIIATAPRLAMSDGKITVVNPGTTGKILDITKAIDLIKQNISNISIATQLNLPQKDAQPLTLEKLSEMGIDTLLTSGQSNFSGSTTSRIHNIKIGASKFDGMLIAPGGEFSFTTQIGIVDASTGYLPELVIKNNKTVPDYGGGLCQVSTTLFRAAVLSGLKITERHPHAYPVRYYDPQGFDATVYIPSPDLRFVNNTTGYILIQSRIEGKKLYFDVFGKDEGKEVKIIGPTITEKNPDGSMKTTLTQQVWQSGTIISSQTFNSSYNSPSLYPKAIN